MPAAWLRGQGGVEWAAGHLVARQDRSSVIARPVRRQLAVLGAAVYAAKSVNDYQLANPDPTSFWKAQGYDLR